MQNSLRAEDSALAPKLTAPQQRPRPLVAFLHMLRSETAGDPARLERALSGLRLYQDADRWAPPVPPPAISEVLGAKLRDYGGSGPPVVFVPSLINPPNILDLSQHRSLLRWLADQGHRPLLLDWGWPGPSRQEMDVAAHVETILLPLLDTLNEAPIVVGYCLGGTMALAATCLRPVRGLALMAAPWHFSGFPSRSRIALDRLWKQSAPMAGKLGLLPMEALQGAFWSLDPARTVSKFEDFAGLAPGSDEAASFVILEDWANDGPPLPYAAARQIFEQFFRNDLPGKGQWLVADQRIDPKAVRGPVLNIVSTTDRIVPAASAAGIGERLELAQGHVGMIVGGRARERLWNRLSDWLFRA